MAGSLTEDKTMNIYICGACHSGKAAIVKRLVEEVPGLEMKLDISESIFEELFGCSYIRFFRRRMWENDIDKAVDGFIQYMDVFKGEKGVSTVFNEGPLLTLSHLLYFGALSVCSDAQKVQVLNTCFDLINQGEHYIVQRWASTSVLDQVSVEIQKQFGFHRSNVFLLDKAADYDSTVSNAVAQILLGKVQLEKDILARIVEDKAQAEQRAQALLQEMENKQKERAVLEQQHYEEMEAYHAEFMQWEEQRIAELEVQRQETEMMLANRKEEVLQYVEDEIKQLDDMGKEVDENGSITNS
jgi:hypothetical protein